MVTPVRPTWPTTWPATTDSPTWTASSGCKWPYRLKTSGRCSTSTTTAPSARLAGDRHLAGGDSPHRRAERRRDVDAGVEMGVAVTFVAAGGLEGEVGRAEALGDRAIQRPDQQRAVAVALGPGQDQRRIPRGGVVVVQGALPVVGRAIALQVRRSGRDGVGGVADVGIGETGELGGVDEGRRQELHRPAGAGLVRLAAADVAAVVGLDLADRGQHRPVQSEAGACFLIEDEVVGRDVGHGGRRVGRLSGAASAAQLPIRTADDPVTMRRISRATAHPHPQPRLTRCRWVWTSSGWMDRPGRPDGW